MRITIVAATGGIGRHLLQQALAAGHDVTAVVRNPSLLVTPVPVVTVDLADPDRAALRSAFEGADAVLSGLGPRRKSEWGIASKGTRAIVDAMEDTDARRLVAISGAGVSTVPTPSRPNPPSREAGAGFLNRYVNTPLARLLLREHFVDVAMLEHELRTSDLEWTAVRAPLLTDRPLTESYRTAFERNVRRGFRIGRADIAHFMLSTVGRTDTIRHAVAAAY